ncbi:MAG TPA: hypothetical protein GXX15_06495 [Clostridia bacterium]|nr:hypothetical protein [Clostridia bacterium]
MLLFRIMLVTALIAGNIAVYQLYKWQKNRKRGILLSIYFFILLNGMLVFLIINTFIPPGN